jgi:hypothetical protein
MEILNIGFDTWTLNSFGAYGPYRTTSPSESVYMFTKAEARRIIKQGSGRLKYTVLRRGLGSSYHPNFDNGNTTGVTIAARSIRFGCQRWDGVNAKKLRQWALSK